MTAQELATAARILTFQRSHRDGVACEAKTGPFCGIAHALAWLARTTEIKC